MGVRIVFLLHSERLWYSRNCNDLESNDVPGYTSNLVSVYCDTISFVSKSPFTRAAKHGG